MAKIKLFSILGALALFGPASVFGQVQMKCRPLDGSNNFLQPDEVMMKMGDNDYQACRPVKEKPVSVVSAVTTTTVSTPQAVVTAPTPIPAAINPPTPTAVMTPVQSCLIVTSAEGHRMRNAIIAGVFTGGIGLATGLIASGGRYEYRDAVNVPPADVKMKYKGDELQKLQQRGVHIVVVRKNDKQGETDAIQNARQECSPH